MAVLFLFTTPAAPPPPSTWHFLSPTFPITFRSFSGPCTNSFGRYSKSKSYVGCRIHDHSVPKERGALIAKASSSPDVGDADAGGPEPPSESEEESVPFENLPLESKLQLKLEQKMRMKLAKKIRLRRKKLVRKRRLRKKGRWPPSKLKKNKNV